MLQDILSSLHETLQLDAEQMAALQGDFLIGSDSFLAGSSKNSDINSLERSGHSSKLSSTKHSQRSNGLHSTQRSLLNATAHSKSNSSTTAGAAHAMQSCPSLHSTSKSSRYLRKHLTPQPSALQQLQAFSDKHSRATQSTAMHNSFVDDPAAMPDLFQPELQRLHLAPASEALQHHDEGVSNEADRNQQVQAANYTAYCTSIALTCDMITCPSTAACLACRFTNWHCCIVFGTKQLALFRCQVLTRSMAAHQ